MYRYSASTAVEAAAMADEDGIDTGVVHGIVKDHDNDHDGEHLWGIKWDDSTEHHDFTLKYMQDFCIKQVHGSAVAPPLITAGDDTPEPEPESSDDSDAASTTILASRMFGRRT